MNREELISQIAHDAKTTKATAKVALDSFLTSVSKTLKRAEGFL